MHVSTSWKTLGYFCANSPGLGDTEGNRTNLKLFSWPLSPAAISLALKGPGLLFLPSSRRGPHLLEETLGLRRVIPAHWDSVWPLSGNVEGFWGFPPSRAWDGCHPGSIP